LWCALCALLNKRGNAPHINLSLTVYHSKRTIDKQQITAMPLCVRAAAGLCRFHAFIYIKASIHLFSYYLLIILCLYIRLVCLCEERRQPRRGNLIRFVNLTAQDCFTRFKTKFTTKFTTKFLH
jgi:hypothetical protein